MKERPSLGRFSLALLPFREQGLAAVFSSTARGACRSLKTLIVVPV